MTKKFSRVVDDLYDRLESLNDVFKYTIKLSMILILFYIHYLGIKVNRAAIVQFKLSLAYRLKYEDKVGLYQLRRNCNCVFFPYALSKSLILQ